MTMYLRRRAAFSAGSRRAIPGDSGRGHDYLCELTVGGQIDPAIPAWWSTSKMWMPCCNRRSSDRSAVELLDQDVPAFRNTPPTPENLAQGSSGTVAGAAPPPQSRLARVTLWPTATFRRPSYSTIHIQTPNEDAYADRHAHL